MSKTNDFMPVFQLAEEETRDVDSPLSSRRCSPDPDCHRPPSACTWSCPCAWRTWWGLPRSTPSLAESHPLYVGGPPAECWAGLEAPELCMHTCTRLFCHVTGLIIWAHLAQRHYTGNVLHIEPHAVIRVVGQLDLLPSFLVCRYMHSGNSDQEGTPISFNFTKYNVLQIQTKHFTYFVLNSAALTAMEMASYRLPSHCRSCGNESRRDFNLNTI